MTTSPTARERLGSVARHIDPLGTTLTFTLEAEGGRQEQGGYAGGATTTRQGKGLRLPYTSPPLAPFLMVESMFLRNQKGQDVIEAG